MRDAEQELKKLRNENRLFKKLAENLDNELRRYRAQPFLEESFEGVRSARDLIELLRRGGSYTQEQILAHLNIGASDSDLVKAVSKQLEALRTTGCWSIRGGVGGGKLEPKTASRRARRGVDPVNADTNVLKDFLQYIKYERNVKHKTVENYFSALSAFYDYLAFERLVSTTMVLPFRKRYLRQYKDGFEDLTGEHSAEPTPQYSAREAG